MINAAEVFMWGTRVAIIHKDNDKPYVSFEYDRDFLDSGIELSPIVMPLSAEIYEFPNLAGSTFRGVPGLVADSLPDKFGNAVINSWLVSQGKTENDFNVIDRLCYTGSRGMGALEYIPATGPNSDISEKIRVQEMADFASEILKNRETTRVQGKGFDQLLKFGTSAGGARAKAIIAWNEKTNEIKSGQIDAGKGFEYWLMKFDKVQGNGDHNLEDTPEYTLIEYAYYKMALAAGIEMNECRIYSEDGANHFMTKRFDRPDGQKLHMQTLGAIAHVDYNYPGLCSYEQAAGYMRRMSMPANDIEQLYRRMVFNVLAVNQDDHVKNISFLMDRAGEWRLSPAYDITFSYEAANQWLSAHQMRVNDKREEITVQDMVEAGKNMDISANRCKSIISDVAEAVGNWRSFANSIGVREITAEVIDDEIRRAADFQGPIRYAIR